jgi:hypothetical protein
MSLSGSRVVTHVRVYTVAFIRRGLAMRGEKRIVGMIQ